MPKVILTHANRVVGLEAIVTALAASKMILFTNTPAIDEDSVLADFTEPVTDMGSPSAALEFSDVYVDENDDIVVSVGEVIFIATAGIPEGGEIMQGFAIVDTAGTTLEGAAYLDEPVAITRVNDGLRVDAVITWPD